MNVMMFGVPNGNATNSDHYIVSRMVETGCASINQLDEVGCHNVNLHHSANQEQCHDSVDVTHTELNRVNVDGIFAASAVCMYNNNNIMLWHVDW